MNIDFSSHPGFSLYVVLLAVSGVLMVGIGATAFSRLSTGWRIFNLIAGLAFLGYAFYLAFLFQGGTYIIFFKAFILPALMVINAIRSAATRRKTQVPQQNGWTAPQQQGWTAPQQQGWTSPQPAGRSSSRAGPLLRSPARSRQVDRLLSSRAGPLPSSQVSSVRSSPPRAGGRA